ncbi:hypothetical protein TNCV_1544051 [Trichonephila clavipes]|nr:hypothetical protein TNCV_1544051 [Trichonephila clavipes]
MQDLTVENKQKSPDATVGEQGGCPITVMCFLVRNCLTNRAMRRGLVKNVGASQFIALSGRQGCILTRTVESNQSGRFDTPTHPRENFCPGSPPFPILPSLRDEKASNHGSIPITIDCNVVAFIVFEEGFHQPIKRTKQTLCHGYFLCIGYSLPHEMNPDNIQISRFTITRQSSFMEPLHNERNPYKIQAAPGYHYKRPRNCYAKVSPRLGRSGYRFSFFYLQVVDSRS